MTCNQIQMEFTLAIKNWKMSAEVILSEKSPVDLTTYRMR